MSDNWINIIPNDPQCVPDSQAQQRAVDFMTRIVGKAEKVTSELTEDVRFIDCGENLERIGCPKCGRKVPRQWWQDQMEYQFEHGYTLERCSCPVAEEWPVWPNWLTTGRRDTLGSVLRP